MHHDVEISPKANWNPCTSELIEGKRYIDRFSGGALYLKVSQFLSFNVKFQFIFMLNSEFHQSVMQYKGSFKKAQVLLYQYSMIYRQL